LKALGVHQHKADIESDDADPGEGHKPK